MSSAAEMDEALDDPAIEHLFIEIPDLDGVSRSKQIDADYARERWRSGRSNVATNWSTHSGRSSSVPTRR